MDTASPPAHSPRWFLIPLRALLITFPLTLLSFAVSLLLGILGIVIRAWLSGTRPNMAEAYRYVAAPVALAAAVIVLVSAMTNEIRRYRQAKALAGIERAS
jgi:hypothetical protein